MSLRVLQLYPDSAFFTGAAVQLAELARGLVARGHHVVVATNPSPVWTEKAGALGLDYRPLPMPRTISLRSVWRLARLLRDERIQVVHAHKGIARTHALIAGLVTRIQVLILNRGVSFPLDAWNRRGYTTRRVTAIVAVCESIRKGLIAEGVDPRKIHVVYSGTDTERFHPGVDGRPIRGELGIGPNAFVLTQIGVRSTKGNDDVVDAMPRILAEAPHARLLLVGARRPEPLRERARARGVAEAVTVLGYRDDVPAILAASDCCVDASFVGHGVTGALREALAVETAVVGTDLEGNPELIRPGETGLLVPPRDPDAIAAAVLTLAGDPELRRRTARAGRQRVEAEFSLRVKVERMEALYRKLLADRA
jgi:glycosyltransferase involved in cell wall biosynthesis